MTSLIIPGKIISVVRGRAIPKPEDNQNTDDIVPARYLKEITFSEMGNYAFIDERLKDGQPVQGHPFNDDRYEGANILIGGANFGCGSSREHAPQALHRYGIDAIIAASFAEIFAGNSYNIGLVGVTVPAKTIAAMAECAQKNPLADLSIDLKTKMIAYGPMGLISFDMPEDRKIGFLNGTWDAMTVLQQDKAGIAETAARLPYLNFK